MHSRRRIRVGVDARSLMCKEPRGEGKSLFKLYREIRLQRPDIEVIFFGDHTAASYRGELPKGVSVVRIDLPGERFATWENIYYPAAAMLKGCNLLHCTSSGGPFWSFQPQVLTIHDLIPICFDDGMSIREKTNFLNRLKRGLANAGRIITVSGHTKTDLLKVFPEIRTPVEVIHWGGQESVSQKYREPSAVEPYLIAFGGEALRKNTIFTFERFASVAEQLPALKLCLISVNSERQRQELIDMASRLGLANRLTLPGFISEVELDELMRNATALLYLSLYEGFGLPVLEAVERGIPVIASDRTSIPEILAGTVGCFPLEDPLAIEQAIISLVTDPAERRRWQSQQREILARFDWTETAAQTIEVLESCI